MAFEDVIDVVFKALMQNLRITGGKTLKDLLQADVSQFAISKQSIISCKYIENYINTNF